jgi:hypothetical protein
MPPPSWLYFHPNPNLGCQCRQLPPTIFPPNPNLGWHCCHHSLTLIPIQVGTAAISKITLLSPYWVSGFQDSRSGNKDLVWSIGKPKLLLTGVVNITCLRVLILFAGSCILFVRLLIPVCLHTPPVRTNCLRTRIFLWLESDLTFQAKFRHWLLIDFPISNF